MKLTPKTKRNISRIIPFGVIWLLSGLVFIISDMSVTRNQNPNPDTDIAFTIPVLIFANFANIFVGTIVGLLEVVFLEKRFVNYSLRSKFFYKFLISFIDRIQIGIDDLLKLIENRILVFIFEADRF